MADGTEGAQKLITFGNLKDGLIRGTKFDRTAAVSYTHLDVYKRQASDPSRILSGYGLAEGIFSGCNSLYQWFPAPYGKEYEYFQTGDYAYGSNDDRNYL